MRLQRSSSDRTCPVLRATPRPMYGSSPSRSVARLFWVDLDSFAQLGCISTWHLGFRSWSIPKTCPSHCNQQRLLSGTTQLHLGILYNSLRTSQARRFGWGIRCGRHQSFGPTTNLPTCIVVFFFYSYLVFDKSGIWTFAKYLPFLYCWDMLTFWLDILSYVIV